MGAGNVQRVYNGWGGKLPFGALSVLAFMALHSRDADAEPWFGYGHEYLAEHVFGITLVSHLDQARRDNQLRRVRNHITPLLRLKAITTLVPATYGLLGPSHVRYRLFLDGPGESSAAAALGNVGAAGYVPRAHP